MKIKLGDFNNAAPPAVVGARQAVPRTGGGDPVAEGLMRTGQQLARIASADDREAEAIAKQAERERLVNEDRARRNRSAATFATYRVDVEELANDVSTRLTDGQVKREDAQKELDEGIAKLKKNHLEPLDPESREALADNLIAFDGHAKLRFTQALQKHARQERLDTFNSAVEAFQRQALTDRDGAIKQAEVLFKGEGAALLGADRAGKGMQGFREQVTFTDVDRRITASKMDGKALGAIEQELAGDGLADLAPERRNYLEGRVQTAKQGLEHKAEVAMRRKVSGLERQERRLTWYVENGQEIPSNEFNAFVRDSKGTEFEAVGAAIIGEQRAVAELGRLPPDKMIAKVREIEASYGATPSREQLMHLDKVRRFADRSLKLLNESPLTYAVQRDGAQVEPLDLQAPGTWASNLATRTQVLTETSARTGVAPKGLFPQEVAALTTALRSASVSDKRQILGALRQGFGDDKVYKATMGQIAADDPVTASAGIAAARGLETAKQHFLADEILRGQELLRPNKKADGSPAGGKVLQMPGDADLMKVFASRAGTAFANNTEAGNVFFQTARAIYAARSDRDSDMTGVMNSSRWDESIAAAVGDFRKHNGRQIVLPYGMSDGDFKDSLRRRVEQVVVQGRVDKEWTPAKLLDLPMQNNGDGTYIFRIGDGKLVGKDGRPVVIDFNVSAPFRPSGDAPQRGSGKADPLNVTAPKGPAPSMKQ